MDGYALLFMDYICDINIMIGIFEIIFLIMLFISLLTDILNKDFISKTTIKIFKVLMFLIPIDILLPSEKTLTNMQNSGLDLNQILTVINNAVSIIVKISLSIYLLILVFIKIDKWRKSKK